MIISVVGRDENEDGDWGDERRKEMLHRIMRGHIRSLYIHDTIPTTLVKVSTTALALLLQLNLTKVKMSHRGEPSGVLLPQYLLSTSKSNLLKKNRRPDW